MILEAVNDFVLAYTDMAQEHIFQGYQNRYALPDEQDVCVISLVDNERIGTNVETWTDTARTIKRLIRFTVDVDFIGTDLEKVRQRASNIEMVAWSGVAYRYFLDFGIASLYASPIQYIPYVDETSQYAERYRVTLQLSKWDTLELSEQTANKAEARLENIDVHHRVGG